MKRICASRASTVIYSLLVMRRERRQDHFLVDFTIDLIIALARQLGIGHTRFLRSSGLSGIRGQKTECLIQILQQVGAEAYTSGPSSQEYIDQEQLDRAGIRLEFIAYDYPEYPQLHPPFDPHISVFDLLFNTGERALDFILSPGERRV